MHVHVHVTENSAELYLLVKWLPHVYVSTCSDNKLVASGPLSQFPRCASVFGTQFLFSLHILNEIWMGCKYSVNAWYLRKTVALG